MVFLKFILLLVIASLITPLDARCRKNQNNPCGRGRTALANYFCGRGPTRQDCPPAYECVIAPNDSYAVCCPLPEPATTTTTTTKKTTVKAGSCPPPPSGFGICIANCTFDSDCGGDQKCCGSCPRKCVNPVF